MQIKGVLFYFLLFLSSIGLAANRNSYRVVFYNVENFFDCADDSLTNDDDFLYTSLRRWSASKYKVKQMHISKVICSIGGWSKPAIVGLCEVENAQCLHDLMHYSGLRSYNYDVIHYESPDRRGIDVAMLYDRFQFRPIHHEPIRIPFSDGHTTTRDILYVKGQFASGDTVHLYVFHSPSRYGGVKASEYKRITAAQTLRRHIDSVLVSSPLADVLVMGVFNDDPTDVSVANVLGATSLIECPEPSALYNMMHSFSQRNLGTYKYHGDWGCLDQIIVSGALLDTLGALYTEQGAVCIYSPDFLLEPDEKYLGSKPLRTYNGYKYQGGYSDHLPVYIDLYVRP